VTAAAAPHVQRHLAAIGIHQLAQKIIA